MAFDGITISAMVQELHKNLDNGRFNKIAQPEADADDHRKGGKRTVQVIYFCKSFSPVDLFYRQKQTKSPDRTKLLYAAPQASGKCKNRKNHAAGTGTCGRV